MENRKFVKILIPIFILGFFITQTNNALAYSIETHAFLTGEVIKFYNRNFPNNKISDDLTPYLLDGSRREDDPPRWMNHFYDPVYNRGLLDTWQKSKDWAQDSNNQNSLTYKVPATIASILTAIQQQSISVLTTETDFTWQRAIRFYVNNEKEKAMFMLGHILHLIEDKAVPDHTRNDPHPGDSPYENWTKQFALNNLDKNLAVRTQNKQPIILNDLNSYFDGLANYSNNNFYSKDTIGIQSGYKIPEPNYKNIQPIGKYYYIFNQDFDGDKYYLVAKKSLNNLIISISDDFILDDIVNESNWDILSTKSAQYGAGVVNLFFQEVEKAKNDPNFVKEEKSFFAQAIETVKNFFAGIFGGQSFQEVAEINLDNNHPGTDQESPTNIKECSFDTSQKPSHSKIIINEVAWMGTTNSANDEWIELKNISQANVDISGWQLLDKDEQIKITFPSGSKIPAGGFYLLERNENAVANIKADYLYTGNLKNSDEGLRFFDANCNLVDEVLASPNWLAGDNTTKKTMERDLAGFGWHTSNIVGGTPKKENSQPVIVKTQEEVTNLLEEIEEEDEEITPQIQQTTSTLQQTQQTANFKQCSFSTNQSPLRQKIIINEVAWMGTANSANDEWIELKNISSGAVDLTGWQLIDFKEDIKIILGAEDKRGVINKKIEANGFYLLERTDDNSVPGIIADFVYTGTLSNSDEGLRLFDANCNLIDEILANPNWSAGDNTTKQTIERKSDLNWQASANAGGTPKAANSSGYISYGGGGGTPTNTQNQVQYPKILINEIQISPTGNRFIELYNQNNSPVDLTGWYLQRKTQTGSSFGSLVSKTYFEGKTIGANSYFLISRGALENTDIVLSNLTLTESNVIQFKNPNGEVVDKVGWGEAQDCEGGCALNPNKDQSLQRKFSNNTFIDTDNNANDFEIQTRPSPKAQTCQQANQAPRAFFVYTPSNPAVGETIVFNAAASTDADGIISLFQWDFGNGQATTTQASTTYSYSTAGNYTVRLIVFDNQNASSTIFSAAISVGINHLVISEIYPDKTKNNFDFVELYNPTNSPVNLKDYSLRILKEGATSTSSLASFSTIHNIAAKSFFLVGLHNYNKSTSTIADISRSYSLPTEKTATIILYNDSNLVDEFNYNPANLANGQSLERKSFYNGVCISAQNDGEFLGNGCDTDSATDFEVRDKPNPQNSQSFPEPRNAPNPPENFSIQYSSSTMELVFNWDISQDYSGVTSTLIYKLMTSDVINIETASTTAEISISEVGCDYQFSIQAFDKEGLASESVSSIISVPSFLSNLYLYQYPRNPDNYLIEAYYNQYPFVPDIYYPYGENSTFKLLVFYLNSEAGKQSNIYQEWQSNDLTNVLPVKYKHCSGGSITQENSLILLDIADCRGLPGGAYNQALDPRELEDNHFIIQSTDLTGDSRFNFLNPEQNYLTIAFYATHSLMPSDGRVPYFQLVAIDKTEYYFGQPPVHQLPQLTGEINLNFDRPNSRITLDWPKAIDLDTLDYLLTYEIKYNDVEEWQSLSSASGTSRLVASGDNFSISIRAKDDFGNYSDPPLEIPWSYPSVVFYLNQTEANDWSYPFGQGIGYYGSGGNGISLQSITPTDAFQFDKVSLRIKQSLVSDSANLKLSVYPDDNNQPDFNSVVISSVISNLYNPDSNSDLTFHFDSLVSFSANSKYWLALEVESYNSGGFWRNEWQNAVATGDLYSGGEASKTTINNSIYGNIYLDSNADWYLKIGMEE